MYAGWAVGLRRLVSMDMSVVFSFESLVVKYGRLASTTTRAAVAIDRSSRSINADTGRAFVFRIRRHVEDWLIRDEQFAKREAKILQSRQAVTSQARV